MAGPGAPYQVTSRKLVSTAKAWLEEQPAQAGGDPGLTTALLSPGRRPGPGSTEAHPERGRRSHVPLLLAAASRVLSKTSTACLGTQGIQVLAGLFQGDHRTPPAAASSYTSRERRSTSHTGACTATA